ncbi:hypothetical protein EJB05_09538, partial [Eragrostis curvula]
GLLTDDELFHSDHKSVFSEIRVGFRLENAGLVFIPCLISNQWLLIVANFIDCRFDVLNPDKVTSDETKKVDIEAIREVLLFQLVCFPYNEERLPIAKKFVDKYFESLLQENSKSLLQSTQGGS